MRFTEVTERTPELINQLVDVWAASVRATHTFLSPAEIRAIQPYVPQALGGVEHLLTAENEDGQPVGFMGIETHRLEMLFLSPDVRGQGLGKRLLQYGIAHYGVETLTVNEQNPQAVGFYEHLGFQLERRTDCDEQGNPYPLLYLRLAAKTESNA